MYGFDKLSLEWFKNYFNERYQFTSVNGYLSEKRQIICGVPQGSLLDPLLFTLFLNDMPKCINCCEIALYADDTCLYTSTKDLQEAVGNLNNDLISLSNWLSEKKLIVNLKKCEAMFMGTAQRLKKMQHVFDNSDIFIDGIKIEQVECCKYLGVVIDRN